MSARLNRPGRVLSYGERQKLERGIAAIKARLRGEHEGIPKRFYKHMDPSVHEDPIRLKAALRKKEKILMRGSPDSLSKHERLEKEKMVQEDREWLQKHMVPKSHYFIRSNSSDRGEYAKVVQGCVQEHSPEFQQRALRFKNNMRQIDPENPNAGNIETIRPNAA